MNIKREFTISSLAAKAEKLLKDDSLFSDSDPESSPISARNKRDRDESQLHKRSKSKKLETRASSKKRKVSPEGKMRGRSRSKSLPRKGSTKSISKEKLDELVHPVPWLQQRYLMKIKIEEMEKLIELQEKKIKKLTKKYTQEKGEIKKLANQISHSQKKDIIIKDLEERIQAMQANEAKLVRELNEQQLVSKDALKRLYELQEESIGEIEKAKSYYKEMFEKKLEEEILKELEDAQRMKLALDEEEKIFNSYAEKCIQEWAENVILVSLINDFSGQKH